ncbi:MAG: hypothetical protein R2728_09220 [Chitinophagales bacterium]
MLCISHYQVENDIARTNTDTLKQILLVLLILTTNYELQPLGSSENGTAALIHLPELFTISVRFPKYRYRHSFRVIVTITVDTNFDVTTFEMVDASHPLVFI